MTKIEWTDETWNPVTGCTAISRGCDHCYAARVASGRLRHLPAYEGLAVGGRFTGEVRLHPDRLGMPLEWRRPRRVFVNSMSDLFHASVPDEFIGQVWGVMALGEHHTFQVLTKRPQRMSRVLNDPSPTFRDAMAAERNAGSEALFAPGWPLQNVWLGTSIEGQDWADRRIPHLLDTPAAVRFLSVEPLLGPVDLSPWLSDGIGWVIVGGESGPNARPMQPEWAREVRDQCVAAGVPFLFKQWGEWAPHPNEWGMDRVGKKHAGRVLDGRTWDQYPSLIEGL